MPKHYDLNTLLCTCAPDNGFAQDAIEHAILTGLPLTGDLDPDVRSIMEQYDPIIEAYHHTTQSNRRQLLDSYAPLLEQIQIAA